jgi:hypothetical protein
MVTSGSQAGLEIDEAETLPREASQDLSQVLDPVGDVVETGSPAGQESPHGGVGTQGFEKFDGPCEGDADPLRLQNFRSGTGGPGQGLK